MVSSIRHISKIFTCWQHTERIVIIYEIPSANSDKKIWVMMVYDGLMDGWVWQHVWTWPIFSDDLGRKIETHHYPAPLNEDFFCDVQSTTLINLMHVWLVLLNVVISRLSFTSCLITCYPNLSLGSYKPNLGLFSVCLLGVRIHTDSLLGLLKFAGVEYVISEELFETLPDEEKQLWHSHCSEVLEQFSSAFIHLILKHWMELYLLSHLVF